MTGSWALPPRMSVTDAAPLLALADVQHGVLRRAQLLHGGITAAQLQRSVAVGRWQEIAGVFVLHNTLLTPAQQQAVATSVGVEVCALAARTAAASYGLRGWPAPCVEVVVRRGATFPALPFPVRVHESRRFDTADIAPGWPPRVSIDRALIDAAAWTRAQRPACGLLAAGVQQRLTTAERLTQALGDAGQVRHRRILAAALRDIGGGAHAVSELDFLRFCRRNGLPEPVLQQVRRESGGRRRYLDATFVRPDGRRVRVEIDGALHLVVRTYWDDMSRGNEMAIDGEVVLRFPSYVIYANDADALAQLRRALKLSVSPAHGAA